MAYTKTNWVDGQTPVNAQNMNNIENGIFQNATDIIILKADNLANIKNINTLTEGLADANNTITSQGQTIQTNTSAIASLKTKTSTLEDTKMTFIDMQNGPRNLTSVELGNIVDNYLNYAIITKIGTDYVVFVFDTIANNEIIFRGLHTYNKGDYVYQDVLVFDDTTGQLIRSGANDTGIASKEWVKSLPSGTEVVANPSGAGTTDLTKLQVGNTIYNIPQGTPIDELLGTWVFNDTIYTTEISSLGNINISFTSNATDYTTILAGGSQWSPTLQYNDTNVYKGGSWINDNYKTITITDTSALTNREVFKTWLTGNATKQGESGGGSSGGGYIVNVSNTSSDGEVSLYDVNDNLINVNAGETKSVSNVRYISGISNPTHTLSITLGSPLHASLLLNSENGFIYLNSYTSFNESQFPLLLFTDLNIEVSGGGGAGDV